MGETSGNQAPHQQSRVVGTSDGPNAETEHRDRARPDGGGDEIDPRQRAGGGPRTHDDTKITRKKGS